MGEVYLAFDPTLRRQVALKLLPAKFTENKVRLSRFEREAYAASSLNHPNILTIYEIGHQDGHHFISNEYIEGHLLREQMAQGLALRELLGIASQIADALAAAHEAGIVHRDIKPENVMVRRDGYVKVLDFGLAKLANDTASDPAEVEPEAPTRPALFQTDPGAVMGTVNYMSPEQARGLEVDGRSDIWSLGVVLYEMVAGKLPFEGPTTTDVLSMILHREPSSLLLHESSLPAELDRIVDKALVKDRDARYQNAKDLSLDLKRLKQRLELAVELERNSTPEELGTTPITFAGTSNESGATQTKAATSSAENVLDEIKRHKLATFAVATLVVVGLAAVAYFAILSKRSQVISAVAVLPFSNQSGDPNMDYLSDGVSESIINNLSQLPGVKVISRSSAFKYKGKEIDPAQVARELSVQAIVTGRVTQRGDQLQVSAELVNVSDKTQMWGEQFNRRMVDALAMQNEISKQIAEKLKLRLTNAEQKQLTRDAEVNPQAYELLLKGRFEQVKGSVEGNKKAAEYFNEAIATDEKYAAAYAGLAQSYLFLMGTGVLDPKEGTPKAEAAVKKSLELDEGLAEAHQSLGVIKFNAWDWVGAEQGIKRAIELNPNLALTHSVYSHLLSCMGRHEQAIAEQRTAKELDPLVLNQTASLGYALYLARQYDQAIEQLKKALELDNDHAFSRAILAYTYDGMGRYNEAIAEYEAHIRLAGDNTSDQCYLGYALAKAGRRKEAEAMLKKLETTKEYVAPAELAVIYLGLDDKEKALSTLERALVVHDLQLVHLGVDPHYDPIRSDPRFRELIRKVGLTG